MPSDPPDLSPDARYESLPTFVHQVTELRLALGIHRNLARALAKSTTPHPLKDAFAEALLITDDLGVE